MSKHLERMQYKKSLSKRVTVMFVLLYSFEQGVNRKFYFKQSVSFGL